MQIIVSLCVGAAGGILAYRAGVPAGGMVGAMVSVAAVNVFVYPMPLLPLQLRLGGQILIGVALGLQVTREAIDHLKEMVVPAALMTVALILAGLLIGYLLHLFTGWDLVSSVTSASPGGMTEMSLLCDALGGDTPRTAVMQLVRMVSVVTVVPWVLRLMLNWGVK